MFLQINSFFKLGQLSGISIVDKERPFSLRGGVVVVVDVVVAVVVGVVVAVVVVGGGGVCFFWSVSGLPYLL